MTPSVKSIYGLIGFPVKHSLSALMHNAAFAHLKIDAEYKLFEVKPEDLNDFVGSLSQKNIHGLNVTIPHKEKVIPLLGRVSEDSKLIGAVNTIKVSDGGCEGFNTDGEGFLKHLTADLGFDPKGKFIALIGAGGAAKAVSVYLSKANPRRISIYDIDKDKAAALVEHLRKNFSNTEFRSAASALDLGLRDCSLLVNATPIGMKESDPLLIDEGELRKDILVYDLIYNPIETKLIKAARLAQARSSNGLGMLLYQGAIAFEIWTAKAAPIEIMRRALEGGTTHK